MYVGSLRGISCDLFYNISDVIHSLCFLLIALRCVSLASFRIYFMLFHDYSTSVWLHIFFSLLSRSRCTSCSTLRSSAIFASINDFIFLLGTFLTLICMTLCMIDSLLILLRFFIDCTRYWVLFFNMATRTAFRRGRKSGMFRTPNWVTLLNGNFTVNFQKFLFFSCEGFF